MNKLLNNLLLTSTLCLSTGVSAHTLNDFKSTLSSQNDQLSSIVSAYELDKNKGLSRAEAALLLDTLLVSHSTEFSVDDYPMPFADVDISSDYADAVKRLSYFEGTRTLETPLTKDNTLFRPLDKVTRQEFIKQVLEASDALIEDSSEYISSFDDATSLNGSWGKKYLNSAVRDRLIVGNNNNLFPFANLSLGEAIIILHRLNHRIEAGTLNGYSAVGFEDAAEVNSDNFLQRSVGSLSDSGVYITGETSLSINSVDLIEQTSSQLELACGVIENALVFSVDTTVSDNPQVLLSHQWQSNAGYFRKSVGSVDTEQVCFFPSTNQQQFDYVITVKATDGIGYEDTYITTVSASDFSYSDSATNKDVEISSTLSINNFSDVMTAGKLYVLDLSENFVERSGINLGVENVVVQLNYPDAELPLTVYSGRTINGIVFFNAPFASRYYEEDVTLSITLNTQIATSSVTTGSIRYKPAYGVSGKVFNANSSERVTAIIINGESLPIGDTDTYSYEFSEGEDLSNIQISVVGQSDTNYFESRSLNLTTDFPNAVVNFFGTEKFADDYDQDGIVDALDIDDDNDGVDDSDDAFSKNETETIDTDGDGIGNNADSDDDGDGVPDSRDLFPLDSSEAYDLDGDGIGDNADTDDDGDGVIDGNDNCKLISNPNQVDENRDGIGDSCYTVIQEGITYSTSEVITGDVLLKSGTIDLNGKTLTIRGDLIQSGGTIVVNDGTLMVTGDYRIQSPSSTSSTGYSYSSGILKMLDAEGKVVVGEHFTMDSYQSHSNYLVAGEMKIAGDITQLSSYGSSTSQKNFQTNGTHKVTLTGSNEQRIGFEDPGDSRFTNLHISEGSDGIYLDNISINNELSADGDALTLKSFDITGGSFSLQNDIQVILPGNDTVDLTEVNLSLNGHGLSINSDVNFNGGSIVMEGAELSIGGDLTQSKGTITLGSGLLSIGGDYRIQSPSSTSSTGYSYSSGILKMLDAEGKVVVGGHFTMDSYQSHSNYLVAGEMKIAGDITQLSSYGSSTSQKNFQTNGTHKVTLTGSNEQRIGFEDPGDSRFTNLHISEGSDGIYLDNISINNELSADGDALTLKSFDITGGSFSLQNDIQVILPGNDTVDLTEVNLSLNGHGLSINSDVNFNGGSIVMEGAELSIGGDLTQSKGTITLGSGLLSIGGDYRIQSPSSTSSTGYSYSSGILKMLDAEGKVVVGGHFTMDSYQSHSNYLVAGEMKIAGDITQLSSYGSSTSQKNFQTNGTHKVTLTGSNEQRIGFEDPGDSRFTNLHISEGSDGIYLDNISINNELSADGDALTLKSFDITGGSFSLQNNIQVILPGNDTVDLTEVNLSLNGHGLSINSDVNFNGGSIVMEGAELSIGGDLTQSKGTITLGSGLLSIGGDYRIQSPSSTSSTGYSYSSGILKMLDAEGKVVVGGHFTMDSYQSHSNYLVAGEMKIAGDITQLSSYGSSTSQKNFQTNGTHKVTLTGSNEQRIGFEDPGDSRFTNLHISEGSDGIYLDNISINNELSADGDALTLKSFDITGGSFSLQNDIQVILPGNDTVDLTEVNLSLNGHGLSINSDVNFNGGSIVMEGAELSIGGDLTQSKGTITLGSGLLSIGGDYRIQSPSSTSSTGYSYSSGILKMLDAEGKVVVGGHFTMDSYQSHSNYLVAGEMKIAGDITQLSSYGSSTSQKNFQTNGTHKVTLTGSNEQRISFEDPGDSRFTNLYIGEASDNVYFMTEVKVAQLFEHNLQLFTLFSDVETNFPDYDGDGVRDHLDPSPQNAAISSLDKDGDGVADNLDAFPDDPSESVDSDSDGIGDNADTDDDNDGMPDTWELANGLDPYDASDAMADSDGDNVINLDEYRASTDPQLQDSDGDGINDDLDQVVGSGLWGYACNVVNDSDSSTRRWGINQYNLADLPNATGTPVYSMSKNRTIQSVACAPSGESVLFSMKDAVRGDYEIYELETASGLVTQITDNDTDDADVTRSRDGRTVAWQVRLADGRQAVELRQYQDNGEFTSAILASANPFVQPSLSPNGEWLTFVQLRPSSFAVMRYDIVNGKYKEVRVIARRKKLYHPSITDDGNKVGWSERTSMLRYRVKDLTEDTTTDVVYNVNGVEHAVLSGDGKHVIYSVNTADHAETYLTALETLETTVIGETLNNPVRYLSNNWLGSLASNGFALNQISGRHLRSVNQSMTLWLKNNGSGVRYTLGSDDAVAFNWQLDNGVLTLTEQGDTSVSVIRLLAATGNQFTVSMISPDGQGGVVRQIDTLYQE